MVYNLIDDDYLAIQRNDVFEIDPIFDIYLDDKVLQSLPIGIDFGIWYFSLGIQ